MSAAKSTIRKNTKPTMLLKPMLANTFGMVMNMRDGPACRVAMSPPEKANTAGMIMRPASMAMPVSKSSSREVDCSMSTSLFK